MKCRACDQFLENWETNRTDQRGKHWDLCVPCLQASIAASWNLDTLVSSEDSGTTTEMSDVDLLELDDNIRNIYLSITKD
jgi:hypothetical protein